MHSTHNSNKSKPQTIIITTNNDTTDVLNMSGDIYDSSELSVSSTTSSRVKSYLFSNNIPDTHIDKHFTFKSAKKPKQSISTQKKHKQDRNNTRSHFIGMLPSTSHSLIHIKQKSIGDVHSDADSDSHTSSTSDDDLQKPSRITKHHWWTRMTIQCACCGICIVEFGWTIVECLIIPYLFLSNTPYYCISWILFFIPIFDSWLQPLVYISFNKLIYKHHQYYYAQLMLLIFTILFLVGFIILPHSNVIAVQLFDPHEHHFPLHHKHDVPVGESLDCFILSTRMIVSIIGYTIMNLSLGYLLIPLRLIMNDAMAKISSKKFFSLRKKAIESYYNDASRQYLSKKAEKNYISSFDALATQIYDINEYNYYLKYSQRSISIYQIIGRCLGYSFASIDWLSFDFVRNRWVFSSHKYGHIDVCFTFTCSITVVGLLIVTLFTIYVHAYAMKKIKKKKKNFYKFKASLARIRKQKINKKKVRIPYCPLKYNYNVSALPMNILRQHKSLMFNQIKKTGSLDCLVPTLQSKLSFDLTRMCNINPRTKCCYFVIDGIQLHQESVKIYMDWHLNQKLRDDDDGDKVWKNNEKIIKKINAWNMILVKNKNKNNLFGLKSDENGLNIKMPFELVLFWWIYFFGWLCVISFLYFFTIFVGQELSDKHIYHVIEDNNCDALTHSEQDKLMDEIRYACLIMLFTVFGSLLIQLFIMDRILSINYCKTLLIISELGISITCILFYFTHKAYHSSFTILLVIILGFFIQFHYNLPYLLIEYKMISIRHKETRKQYRFLAYYCSLIEKQFDNAIDRGPFDAFENSNKLLQIEQLKQHILQQYNLAFFFALVIISLCTGLLIDRFSISSNNHFVFSIVSWGVISAAADFILLTAYFVYQQCWKPYKKRQKQAIKKKQEELDEWRLKRAQNANNYCTFTQTLQENGIKSFVKDKAQTINQNLNVFNDFNKNNPIERASASTLKLFDLKKDLRNKYKYKKSFKNVNELSSSKNGDTSESYLQWSVEYKPSPLMYPNIICHPNKQVSNDDTDNCDGYLDYMDDNVNSKHDDDNHDISPTILLHNVTKHQTIYNK